jgi:hypothetical protein
MSKALQRPGLRDGEVDHRQHLGTAACQRIDPVPEAFIPVR